MAIFNSYIKLPEGRSCKVWTKPSKLWSSCGKVCIRAIAKPLEQRDAPSNQHGFLWIYGIRNTPNIQCQNMSKSSCSPPFSPIFARNSIWVSEIPSPMALFFHHTQGATPRVSQPKTSPASHFFTTFSELSAILMEQLSRSASRLRDINAGKSWGDHRNNDTFFLCFLKGYKK